jgi:hypothetical protein
VRSLLAARLLLAWQEARAALPAEERAALEHDCAALFASTKGCTADFVWNTAEGDPYAPVVEEFLRSSGLHPRRWLTVSNACASSHSALHLAREWLEGGAARYVVVLTADFTGPFVLQGFHALKALSASTACPFDGAGDGLLLGEAAGAVILSQSGDGPALLGSAIDCEGHAHHAKIAYPATDPPFWAPLVERWYQLDPFAYRLPEAFARFNVAARPSRILLACAGASNFTDHAFATGGAASPTKFAHTLPNIRASALLSVMRWDGPVLSLHRNPTTLACSFREAFEGKGGGSRARLRRVRTGGSRPFAFRSLA